MVLLVVPSRTDNHGWCRRNYVIGLNVVSFRVNNTDNSVAGSTRDMKQVVFLLIVVGVVATTCKYLGGGGPNLVLYAGWDCSCTERERRQ